VRVAIYARVSTTANQSVEMQLRDLRELAARRGLEIVEEYCDEGVSGSKDSRPGLNRLLADAEAGKFSVVLVWKLDRLGRSLIHLVRLMEDFGRLGIELVSFSEGLDFTTTTGKLLYQIICAFSEFERDCIRERVRAGMRNAKAKGKRIGRPPRTWLSEETRKDIALAYQRGEGSLRQLAVRYSTSAGTVQRCVASYQTLLAKASAAA
jgi:DNA invertase Pin-like site-specific DNA recombinase